MSPVRTTGRFIVLAAEAGVITFFLFLVIWTYILSNKSYMRDNSWRLLPCSFPPLCHSLASWRAQAALLLPSDTAQLGYFSHLPGFSERVDISNFTSVTCEEKEGSSTPQCGWRAWSSCLSFCPPHTVLMAAASSPDIPVFFPVRDIPTASLPPGNFQGICSDPKATMDHAEWMLGWPGVHSKQDQGFPSCGGSGSAFQLWKARLYWT